LEISPVTHTWPKVDSSVVFTARVISLTVKTRRSPARAAASAGGSSVFSFFRGMRFLRSTEKT
jgi:hypothetical protein